MLKDKIESHAAKIGILGRTTAHSAFNAKEILSHSKLVIDTRNIMRGLSANHLVRL